MQSKIVTEYFFFIQMNAQFYKTDWLKEVILVFFSFEIVFQTFFIVNSTQKSV